MSGAATPGSSSSRRLAVDAERTGPAARLRAAGLGLFVMGFALVLAFVLIPLGISKPSNIRVAVLSPVFWPDIVAWGLFLGGSLLALQGLLAKRGRAERMEQATGAAPWLRVLALAAIMAAYYALIPVLGMVWASVLAFLAVAALGRARQRVTALVVALALPLVIYGFFSHVAGVPIPQGDVVRLP